MRSFCNFFTFASTFVSLSFAFNITGPGGEITSDSTDDIKSVSKTIASAISSTYNELLKNGGSPGLFGEPSDDTYYFWEAGVIWNALLDYSHLTGDNQFDDLISSALLFQRGELNNFMPANQSKSIGNDDQSYWALAAISAAENGFKEAPKSENTTWIDLAVNVFNDQAARWDTKTCAGGLRWQIFSFNNGYNYKNAVSAANFFLLSSRLAAQFPKNTTYSTWAEKTFDWAQAVGFVTKGFHVYDGAMAENNCSSINKIQWTAYHATFTEGSAVMYNLTNGDSKWKNIVAGFVNSSSVFRTGDGDGYLYEVACERIGKCNLDQKAFKGVAVRSYARAALVAPFTSDYFRKLLEVSAIGATINCDGDENDVKCDLTWDGSKDANSSEQVSVKDEGLGEVFGALSVTQALLWPQAKPGSGSNSSGNSTEESNPKPSNGAGSSSSSILSASPIVLLGALLAALSL